MELSKMEIIVTIVCSILGSAGIFSFIQFLIERRDKKKGFSKELMDKLDKVTLKVDDLENRVHEDELETTRIQLLLLIKDFPDDQESILKVAQKYFDILHGDWYLTRIFNKWCEEHCVKPEWFDLTR